MSDSFDNPLQGALWLAEQGFEVFPLDHPELPKCVGLHKDGICRGRGKEPAIGFKNGQPTRGAQEIYSWWAGSSRNVAVFCGPSLLVVDEDGPGELARYCASVGVELPVTFTVTTAKGKHHYFRVPDELSFGNREGVLKDYRVNIRSGNGYVVGPGSLHASGMIYTPEDESVPVATMPTWLVEALSRRPDVREPETLVTYDGQLYEAHSPPERDRLDGYVHGGVESELQRLDACRAAAVKGWWQGDTRYKGTDWDATTFEVGCKLAEFARSPWNGYTFEQAQADLLARAPRDEGFTEARVLDKWEHVVDHTASNIRPYPDDPTRTADPLADIEESLFGETVVLNQIRQAARSRLVSPWGLLLDVLARVSADLEPCVDLPPIVGSRSSLNFFGALVAKSGGGKSITHSVGADLLPPGMNPYKQIGPGTGEGIIQTFLKWVPPDKNLKTAGHFEPADVMRALLFADEVAQIGALQARLGQTFGSVIRSMWSGVFVGTTNADPTRNRHLDAGTYRLSIIAGVQPAKSDVLLNDEDAGTPQRVVWATVEDPSMPDDEPEWPGALQSPSRGAEWDKPFQVEEPIRRLIQDERRKRVRQQSDALDGHMLLTRLIVAALLSVLHQPEHVVTQRYWDLAGIVIEASNRTRQICQDALRDKAEGERKAQGRGDAQRAAGAREAVADSNMPLARKVWALVSKGSEHSNSKHQDTEGCTQRCLMWSLRHDRGADKEGAIRQAEDLDWIEQGEDGRWRVGSSQPASGGERS